MLETSSVYQDADAKLRRAFQDLHSFNTDCRAFLNPNPYTVGIEFDRESKWWIARMQIAKEPHPDLGVLVGDIAYQCLSAFNILIWELVARKKGRRRVWKLKRDVQIPVALSASAFRDNPLCTRQLVSKPALAAIERLQPYKDGYGPGGPREHPLPLIKEIADSDKHRVVTGAFGEGDLSATGFTWDPNAASDPESELLIRHGVSITPETPILRIRFRRGNAKAKVKVKRQPTFDLVFQTDTWSVPWDKVETLPKWTQGKFLDLASLFPAK